MDASVSPLAGKPAPPELLIDVRALLDAYVDERPDSSDPAQQVSFGTSGHRGSAFTRTFNEWHILATTQAICDYRAAHGIDGPLYIGRDTHALSEPATNTALEVLVANGAQVMVDVNDGFTPTPVISHAILTTNRGRTQGLADGIVVTPSHNPPTDGGFKYNPPNGGPADTSITRWIQDRANELMAGGLDGVKRVHLAEALGAVTKHDYQGAYIPDLARVVDVDAIRSAGVHIGADPLGGAAVQYWGAIAERLRLDITVVNPAVDPTFEFMTVDWDGKIRMDCSSPYAMAGLIGLKDDFDVAFANDTDSDRHGIVTGTAGLLPPNHYLAVAVAYLFRNRPDWPQAAAVGKTVVSSSMIDRVAADVDRRLFEVPVGFKWFVDGLLDGSLGFGGEESAGGSFLRFDGTTWTTDKDGIILCLLAAEITARTGRDPGAHYQELTSRFGDPAYRRIDAPATPEMKAALSALTPDQVSDTELAGEPIQQMLTTAPGDGAPIGGLKVIAENGWFAARPSGTEDVYKVYGESFLGSDHLDRVLGEAQRIVNAALGASV